MIAQIYTTPMCPYCDKAKALLRANGIRYRDIEIDSSNRTEALNYLSQKADTPIDTVPQVLFGEKYIGGLPALEKYLNGR